LEEEKEWVDGREWKRGYEQEVSFAVLILL
jgi:hypothetical protein